MEVKKIVSKRYTETMAGMLSVIHSGALSGIEALPVQVEVNTEEPGDPRFIVVGLPDASVKESQNRVFSALSNSGFRCPTTRTIVNLAPGDIRKEGTLYDLPIAIGILLATRQQIVRRHEPFIISGELSLSGETRPIKGALPLALMARKCRGASLLLPPKSAQEAALVTDVPVYAVSSLQEAIRFLAGEIQLAPITPLARNGAAKAHDGIDLSEVKGQKALKRALEVAVSGGHNLLMIGPPGSGKSMVAKCLPSILPPPSMDELIEVLCIHSAAGMTLGYDALPTQRPFRAPHHTISDAGLIGGGTIPSPGEISLAHQGVLFLDELAEFRRSALEVLRQPLEDRNVTISRSAGKVTLPACFMLVAAMNPCPCGFWGDPKRECRCSVPQIQRYRSRISGPVLDRIDIHVEVPAVTFGELRSNTMEERSQKVQERVQRTREIQQQRGQGGAVVWNARLSPKQITEYCSLTREQEYLLQQAVDQLGLSARALHRVLKVARTIADMDAKPRIQDMHLLEAIQYRSLDRNTFI